jgi:ubiquitin carboxyl-terminal hydrolase 9/24
LQSFVEGEMLEGENAYLCEKCDKRVSTLKRVCIKRLPNNLILVLKRFEFDFE